VYALGLAVAGAAAVVAWNSWTARPPIREGAPGWTPDGRRLVFYSEQPGGKADLFIMDADGGNRRRLFASEADEGAPAVSPNGQALAYDTDRDGNFEIYARALDGSWDRRLTSHPGRDVAPAWSPDGEWIVFMSDRLARPEFDVYRMKADGSAVERLTTQATNWFPQFAPNGRTLALHVWRDVHLLHLESRVLQRLTVDPANGMYPSWSPDGGRIAFMSWRNGPTELFTMNADGTDQTRLVTMPQGSAIDPRWSPDGRRIAFVHVPERSVHDQQTATESRLIYVVDLETRQLTPLSR
jgi:Tol biopolymer transport system component